MDPRLQSSSPEAQLAHYSQTAIPTAMLDLGSKHQVRGSAKMPGPGLLAGFGLTDWIGLDWIGFNCVGLGWVGSAARAVRDAGDPVLRAVVPGAEQGRDREADQELPHCESLVARLSRLCAHGSRIGGFGVWRLGQDALEAVVKDIELIAANLTQYVDLQANCVDSLTSQLDMVRTVSACRVRDAFVLSLAVAAGRD